MKAVSPLSYILSYILSYLYVDIEKGKEKKRNMYASQINFRHDLQPAYGGLSFEYR